LNNYTASYRSGAKHWRDSMKLNLHAASFLALALFTMPLVAQEAQPAENLPVADSPKAVVVVVPEEVQALLADTRPANELSLDELQKREKTAKRFAQVKSLPADLHDQLKHIAEVAQAELEARQQAAEQKAASDQAAQEQAAADKAAKDQAAQEQAASDKAAKEQAAAEKAAKAQAAADKAAANQAAQEQAASDKAAKEQAAADKAAKAQAAADKAAANQPAQEQAAAEKAAKAQASAEKLAADTAAKELAAAADKAAQEQAAADKAAKAQAAQEQAAADKPAKAQAAQEQAAADKAAKEQAAAGKAIADKVAKDQAAIAQAKADQTAADQAGKDQTAAQKDQQASASKPPVVQVAPAVPAPNPAVAEATPPVPMAKAPVAEVTPAPTSPAVKVPLAEAAPSSAPAVPAVEMPPPKLVLKEPPVLKVVPPPPAPPPESKPLPQVAVATPVPQAIVAVSAADAKALDSNIVDPISEKQAQVYLADKSELTKLSDDDFRKRLDAIRELMTANELAHDTERAVREKLKIEREVLRQRIALAEAAQQIKNAQAAASNTPPAVLDAAPKSSQATAATGGNTTNITNTTNTTNIITVLTPPQQVLRDRRPAENLNLSELQIRIQIFGDAQSNNAYDPSYRDYWRASVERDRAILRRRLIQERHRREAEMAMQASDDTFEISNDYVQSDRPRRDVFAAEIDSHEMVDVLVAPPRQFSENPHQRYKVDQIATQPKLRNSISRIEIDTIRFGTNEAFIRDEQVRNLDAIAAIIEKIVRKYPNEVFLIEGHTDAPGSASYNERLSKLRAESIKRALVSYYVIPAKNLRTVGLGKRFLKIPTAEAEPENRRVSIARITPLLVQR
jgi:outer membrane protein OmpA-like peptidoglycan-associated protein